jgi:hypothetical protein
MEDIDENYNIEEWYGDTMELRCLLNSMTSSSELITDRVMVEQISRARLLLNKIQQRLELVLVDVESEHIYEDASKLLESLEMRTETAIQHCSEKLKRSENKDDRNNGLLNYIFTDDIESDDELELLGHDDEVTNLENESESELEPSISEAIESISKPNLTSEELQRQQEELLEEEISEMAKQLKTSSLAIKSTLANQNQQLEEIETITMSNLDKTKDMTDKVTEEVKRGWRKAASRWFIFIIILGTWMFCFLTIRVVPKRKNACLFFCGGTHARKEKGKDNKSVPDDEKGQSSSNAKDILPKYSFCTENGSECTRPMDPDTHIQTMEKLSPDKRGEDVAFDLSNQLRWDRQRELKAQHQKDEVSSKRVQEGWNGVKEEEQDLKDGNRDYNEDYDEEAKGNKLFEEEKTSGQNNQQEENNASYSVKEMLQAVVDNHFLILRKILKIYPEWVSITDKNGWQPIHEAAYSGSLDTLRIVIEEFGADVNSRTGIDHRNGSVLWWALQKFESNHPIVIYLTEMGAVSISPDDIIGSDDRSEL